MKKWPHRNGNISVSDRCIRPGPISFPCLYHETVNEIDHLSWHGHWRDTNNYLQPALASMGWMNWLKVVPKGHIYGSQALWRQPVVDSIRQIKMHWCHRCNQFSSWWEVPGRAIAVTVFRPNQDAGDRPDQQRWCLSPIRLLSPARNAAPMNIGDHPDHEPPPAAFFQF